MAAERCKAKTKEGRPCKAPARQEGLCLFHSRPDLARTLGRKGGQGNRRYSTELVVPEDSTVASLGLVLDQALRELLAGRLHPRVASAVTQVVNARRRLIETDELQTRLAELERKLAEQGSAAADAYTPEWMRETKGADGTGDHASDEVK